MKYYINLLIFAAILLVPNIAASQSSSNLNASYLATLKAVMDVKINDEEELDKINKLRQDERFNKKLLKRINKLNNSKNKDYKNKKILQILEAAGKEIGDILD